MLDIEELTKTFMLQMKRIIESGQEAMPVLFVVKEPEEIEVYGIAGMSEDRKDAVGELIREKTLEEGTVCTVFLAEAWTTTAKSMEEFVTARRVHGSVRYMPERKEAISASICGRGMKPFLATWMFSRDASGNPVFEPEPDFNRDATETKGRFVPEQNTAAVS